MNKENFLANPSVPIIYLYKYDKQNICFAYMPLDRPRPNFPNLLLHSAFFKS